MVTSLPLGNLMPSVARSSPPIWTLTVPLPVALPPPPGPLLPPPPQAHRKRTGAIPNVPRNQNGKRRHRDTFFMSNAPSRSQCPPLRSVVFEGHSIGAVRRAQALVK